MPPQAVSLESSVRLRSNNGHGATAGLPSRAGGVGSKTRLDKPAAAHRTNGAIRVVARNGDGAVGGAREKLDIVIIGLSITSSWGNGHATTYRGLVRELARRGHDVLFLEHDRPWY